MNDISQPVMAMSGSGDPADLSGSNGVAASDTFLTEQAIQEAKILEDLAGLLEQQIRDTTDPDQKLELAALKGQCLQVAGNLRSGQNVGGALAAASGLYSRAYREAQNAEKEQQEDQYAEASAAGAGVTRTSMLAATNSYMMYAGLAASRLQDEIKEKGAQAAVAENLMESDAAQYIWENRENIARERGYAVGSEDYNQLMKQSLERAVANARGELREDIFNELKKENPELYAQYMREHPGFNPMDRTQDDANYQRHYNDAAKNIIKEGSGWTQADLDRLERAASEGYKDPNDKNKDFMLALTQDPNAARAEVAKYGAGLSKQELIEKIKAEHPGITDAELQQKTDQYLTASVTLDFHNSLAIEDTRLRETQLLSDAGERDIDQRVRNGEISAVEGRKQKEDLHETTMQRMEAIRSESLSPGEFHREQQRQRDEAVDAQSKIKLDILDGQDGKLDKPKEKRADLGVDENMQKAMAQADHMKQLVVNGIVSPAHLPPEYSEVAAIASDIPQQQRGATPDDIFKLSRDMFAGISGFQVANLNDGAAVSPMNNAVAAGFQKAVDVTKAVI